MLPAFTSLTLALAALLSPADPPRIPVDNGLVRVIRASNVPGQKSGLHKHETNRVMIHLDQGYMRLAFQGASVKDVRFQAGEVRWDPADGLHTSENAGPASYHIVEVEIKKPKGSRVRYSAQDPPKTDPKHYRVELENDQVRVLRVRYGPRDSAPVHEHALPRITVNLTDQAVRLTLPDGSTSDLRRAAGEIVYADTVARHSEVNLNDQPFEVVVVELKTVASGQCLHPSS